MAFSSFIILVWIQLFSFTFCEPRGPPTKQLFEVEQDSSGESNFINGFVEQEPPDARDFPQVVIRGSPAPDDIATPKTIGTTSTTVTQKTTETTTRAATEKQPESTSASTTTSSATTAATTTRPTQETIKDEQDTVEKVDATTQTEKEIKGRDDVDISCPVGPRSNLLQGFPGRDGLPGRDGNPGIHGIPGIPGAKGESGSCDCREEMMRLIQSNEFFVPNIHQCAWNKLNWSLEAGKVVTCTFSKKHAFTSLKVEWYGALRILCNRGSPCCNRWYITFNGAECANPMTIDGVVFTQDHNVTINIHRSTAIAGICSGVPQGLVDVSLWTGGCDGIYPSGPSRTGWNSASRIIIEEIPI